MRAKWRQRYLALADVTSVVCRNQPIFGFLVCTTDIVDWPVVDTGDNTADSNSIFIFLRPAANATFLTIQPPT
jgi:hypothetical protein